MSLQLKVAGKTDKGLVRPANEDCLHLDENNRVFAICDGMGGHQAGEVASMMAADMLDIVFGRFPKKIRTDPQLALGQTLPDSGDILVKSIRLANRAIFNKAIDKPTLIGMGTTVVALAFDGDMLSIAHVGDSRAYRIAGRSLEPLTVDHSWVAEIKQNQNLTEEEAASVVGKNVITRALGVRDTVEVDYRMTKVKAGEKYLLCSDGLCGFADDDEIFSVIYNVRDDNEQIVDNLIQMANDRGGADNVTVAVIEVVSAEESDIPPMDTITLPEETQESLAAEDDWLNRIAETVSHDEGNTARATGAKPVKTSMLLLIFAVFIVVAAVILYFATK